MSVRGLTIFGAESFGRWSVPHVAFYTFGILHEAGGHPQVQGFRDRVPGVYEEAGRSLGYITHRTGPPGGGYALGPRFFDPIYENGLPLFFAPQTLSLWADLDAVFAFSYRHAHAEALRLRREWFKKLDCPTYVAWWATDGYLPEWPEAWARLEHVHDNGSTAHAFSFITPYDAEGKPIHMMREDRSVAGRGPQRKKKLENTAARVMTSA